MKRIFKGRFARSNSTDSPLVDPRQPHVRRYSFPEDSPFEILHAGPSSSFDLEPADELLPNTSLEEATVLSDTETLHFDRLHRLELQDSYNENYTQYLPFVIRRMRVEAIMAAGSSGPSSGTSSPRVAPPAPSPSATPQYVDEYFDDDQLTIFNEALTDTDGPEAPAHGRAHILGLPTSRFTLKRQFILASELIKNNTYIFVDRESFSKFKALRASSKKARKSSVIVYDKDGNIKKLSITPQTKFNVDADRAMGPSGPDDDVIDHRQHIIPLENKLKGEGLPLMKVQVPYMSSFRKNTPFMIFRRYREIPLRPSPSPTEGVGPLATEEDDDHFQSYPFCSVHTKNFLYLKRYTLKFTPIDRPGFTLVVFQHNFRQFADFRYRNTRFRVLGTPLAGGYLMTYNPHLKLLIIDDDKPSLTDNIINKKTRSSFTRRKSTSDVGQDYFNNELGKNNTNSSPLESLPLDSPTDATSEYPNPYPDASNPLLSESHYGFFAYTAESAKDYIPNDMPPFGEFSDAQAYLRLQSILPKKYTETGKIEVYQDANTINHENESSSLSVDFDSLVISCVMLVLRENSLRNSTKSSNGGLGGRINAIGPGFGPSPYISSMS